jgi:hypothetical protein
MTGFGAVPQCVFRGSRVRRGFPPDSWGEDNLGTPVRDAFWTVKIAHFPHRTRILEIPTGKISGWRRAPGMTFCAARVTLAVPDFTQEVRVSAPVITPKTRLPWLHRILQIEQVLVFIGLVVYAIMASLNQKPPLLVMMIAILTVGNLLIPLAILCRRIYATRPFPWNWVVFIPVQIMFGFLCAFGSIVFLQYTGIDRGRSGYSSDKSAI